MIFKKKFIKYKNIILYLIIGIAWLLILGILQYRNIGKIFNSDWAADLIFARQCAKEKVLISHNLCYTTEFKMFDLQLIKALMFSIFDSWVKITAWGNTFAFFLLYLLSIKLMKQINIQKKSLIFISSITFILPFSWRYAEIALIAGFYTIKIITEIALLSLFYGIIKAQSKKKMLLLSICIAILSIISGIGGIRLTLLIFIPILVTCILQFLIDVIDNKDVVISWKSACIILSRDIKAILVSGLLLLFNIIGYIINIKYYAKEYQFESQNSILFGNLMEIGISERISNRFAGVLDVLGYYSNVNVFSMHGLSNLVVILLILCLFYCYIFIFKNIKKLNFYQKNIILLSIVAIMLNGFIFCITDYHSSRYWVPLIILIIPVFSIFINLDVESWSEKIIKTFIGTVCLIYIVLGCFMTIQVINKSNTNTNREDYIEFLEENEYEFGYATYWNANVTTAITNGNVEIASISNPELMEFYLWGTTKDYYKRNYHEGKCFILLTSDEYEVYKTGNTLAKGIEVYRDQNYTIYEYESTDLLLETANKTYLGE